MIFILICEYNLPPLFIARVRRGGVIHVLLTELILLFSLVEVKILIYILLEQGIQVVGSGLVLFSVYSFVEPIWVAVVIFEFIGVRAFLDVSEYALQL